MSKKYLECYKEWMEKGEMPKRGLCNSLPEELRVLVAFDLVKPTEHDMDNLRSEGLSGWFWASGLSWDELYKDVPFTPLRQTILLLCAAMNDEL